jgi:hypothetical protein
VTLYVPPLAGWQRFEQLSRLWPIGTHRPPGGWVCGDGNGAPGDVIVNPGDGNLKGSRDLRHRQATGEVTWRRLPALLKQPMLSAKDPHRSGSDGLARRRAGAEHRSRFGHRCIAMPLDAAGAYPWLHLRSPGSRGDALDLNRDQEGGRLAAAPHDADLGLGPCHARPGDLVA